MRIGIKTVQGDLSCQIISGRCPLLVADGLGVVRGFTAEQERTCLILCFQSQPEYALAYFSSVLARTFAAEHRKANQMEDWHLC